MKKLISFAFIMLLTIISFSTLSSCTPNPENCVHDWGAPTCLEPAQCYKCGTYKTGGALGNHNYSPATCREPAKCIYCHEYKDDNLGTHEFSPETGYCYHCGISRDSSDNTNNIGNNCANGHTNGDWIVTQNSTLVDKGTEEMTCKVCGELIDSRTIQKKLPQVENDYFNFTDVELIDWINDVSTAYVYSADLEIFNKDSSNTSYKIVMQDGEAGAILLNHGDNGKNGNIQAIMVYFDDVTRAYAVAAFIGGKINSSFDDEDACKKLIYGKTYCAADMAIFELELDDDFIVTVLAPVSYIEDLLD